MLGFELERTPGFKLFLAIVVGAVLIIPSFRFGCPLPSPIPAGGGDELNHRGLGGPQVMTGPVLVIPYHAAAAETVIENGQSISRTSEVMKELTLAPEAVDISTDLRPDVRKRSIYEAVV